MVPDRVVVLVTGGIARGKTRFLQRLRRALGRRWRLGGFVAADVDPPRALGTPSRLYRLDVIDGPSGLAWARRRDPGPGYDVDADTGSRVASLVRQRLAEEPFDAYLHDEVGPLELAGGGFALLLRDVLASGTRVVVATVRPALLAQVAASFDLHEPVVVDLDAVAADRALKAVVRLLQASDAERVGAYAGVGGLVEVGLGSTLHAWRVPFKGHALAYLQAALLTTFGKPLRGRGLTRISFLSALLKAFSPAGSTLKPMGYIFVQGATFALPVRLFGWNLPAVLLGSVLMAWLTLALALAVDYVTFGQSLFDAFSGAIDTVGGWLGVRDVSLIQVLAALFVLKALVALALAVAAYRGDLRPLFERLRRARVPSPHAPARGGPAASRPSLARSALLALRDLVRPRVLVLLVLSVLLILAFANLSGADALVLALRGLCVTYVGFLAARRLDPAAVGRRLDAWFGLGLARSLPVALRALDRPPGPAAAEPSGPRDGASPPGASTP